MSSKTGFNHEICTYCGTTGSLTRDHLPARSLFKKPRPSSLITVPSCLPCNAFLRGVREVNLFSKAGIYMGRAGTYHVDLQRLNSVANRIVKGLFFHHYKKHLPFGRSVDMRAIEGFAESDVVIKDQLHKWAEQLKQNSPAEIGRGVFKYWHRLADANSDGSTDEFASVWLLTFFESSYFFGITSGSGP